MKTPRVVGVFKGVARYYRRHIFLKYLYRTGIFRVRDAGCPAPVWYFKCGERPFGLRGAQVRCNTVIRGH